MLPSWAWEVFNDERRPPSQRLVSFRLEDDCRDWEQTREITYRPWLEATLQNGQVVKLQVLQPLPRLTAWNGKFDNGLGGIYEQANVVDEILQMKLKPQQWLEILLVTVCHHDPVALLALILYQAWKNQDPGARFYDGDLVYNYLASF